MNIPFEEILEPLMSRKMMAGMLCMWLLKEIAAPSWQIMVVGLAIIAAQTYLDRGNPKQNLLKGAAQ